MLEREPPYAGAYRHMRDVVLEHGDGEVYLGFAAASDADMRRYNHPQTLEPAVLFVGGDGAPPSNRDIVVWPHDVPPVPRPHHFLDPTHT